MTQQRNELCKCGSGKKFKVCCMITEREKQAKTNGECFTPLSLVNEMLDKLPKDVWKDPSKTYIDPAAGNGNFIIEVIKRKILKYHHLPLQAIYTTYGIELMQDNVDECKKRIINFLKESFADYGMAISCHGCLMMGITSKMWWNNVNRILNHHIKCADALKWNFDTWNGEGQIPMWI